MAKLKALLKRSIFEWKVYLIIYDRGTFSVKMVYNWVRGWTSGALHHQTCTVDILRVP